MPNVRINELDRHVGQSVTVRGWVATTRSSGKIAFVVLRDGSGYLQAVFSKSEVPEATWASALRAHAGNLGRGDRRGAGGRPCARRA